MRAPDRRTASASPARLQRLLDRDWLIMRKSLWILLWVFLASGLIGCLIFAVNGGDAVRAAVGAAFWVLALSMIFARSRW